MRFGFYLALVSCLFLSLGACQTSWKEQTALEAKLNHQERDSLLFAEQQQKLPPVPHSLDPDLRELREQAQNQGGASLQKIFVQENPKDTQTQVLAKQAALLFSVRDFNQSKAKIQTLFQAHQVQVLDQEERRDSSRIEIIFSLKLKQNQLDAFLNKAQDLALLLRQKRLWTQDVQLEQLDLQTRLQRHQNRLQQLENQSKTAKNLEDNLAYQAQIEQIQTQIQVLERAARQLQDQKQLAYLSLAFYQNLDPLPKEQADFSHRLEEGLGQGWQSFQEQCLLLAQNWVWVVLALALLLALWLGRRKQQREQQRLQEQSLQAQQQWFILQQQQKSKY